jgi:thioredoxin
MPDIIHATTATFDEEVLRCEKPVVVDLWAEWCGPCRALAPTIERLNEEYAGAVRFVKVDTNANPELIERLGVQGIPLLLVYVKGELLYRLAGKFPRRLLRQRFDEAFAQAGVAVGTRV